MFKNFLMLAMAIVFLNGCAISQNTRLAESSATFEEKFTQIKHQFIVIYGEYGRMVTIKRNGVESEEDYANMLMLLAEPGFIAMIDEKAKAAGLDAQLEDLFEAEGFNMVGGRKHEIGLYRMNFARNGKRVIFG